MGKRIEKALDFLVIFCLLGLIICTTFSKAGVESLAGAVILFWFLKRLTAFKSNRWNPRYFFPDNFLNKPLAIYVLIIVLSTFNSVDFKSSLTAFIGKTLEYVLLYFAVIDTVNTKKRIYVIVGGIVVAAFGLILDSGFQYFTGLDLFRHFAMNDDHRLKASFGNANDLAGWLILITPLLITSTFFRKKQNKIITVILGITSYLAALCLLLTYSKAAILGLILSCLILLFYFRLNKKFLIFLVILILAVVFISNKKGYVFNLLSVNSTSVLVRKNLWKRAINMAADYPILGSGPSTYVSLIGRYSEGWEPNTAYPHNSFLHIAAETGIAGLLAFLWIILRLAKEAIKKLKRNRDNVQLAGFSLGIIAFLFQSFFDTNLTALQLIVPFWIFVGLTVSLVRPDFK